MTDDLHIIEREVFGAGNEPGPDDDVVQTTFNLQVIGPAYTSVDWQHPDWWMRKFQEMLEETEENLTDLLPEGYRVEIKEWDQE